jgi:hypothetical protein
MTLAELTAGWTSYGFSIKQAVHELVAIHLRHGNAKGRGNHAKRRIAALSRESFLAQSSASR